MSQQATKPLPALHLILVTLMIYIFLLQRRPTSHLRKKASVCRKEKESERVKQKRGRREGEGGEG